MSTTSMILVEKIRRFVDIKFVKLSDEQEINLLTRLVKLVQKNSWKFGFAVSKFVAGSGE